MAHEVALTWRIRRDFSTGRRGSDGTRQTTPVTWASRTSWKSGAGNLARVNRRNLAVCPEMTKSRKAIASRVLVSSFLFTNLAGKFINFHCFVIGPRRRRNSQIRRLVSFFKDIKVEPIKISIDPYRSQCTDFGTIVIK